MAHSVRPVARPNLRQLSSTTLADQAYEALREAIISGELAPREKITERGLAERLSVSPTPVREALRRLEQDHLVERSGPRAVQVADLDDATAGEIRLVEGTLRALAARLAATNATPAQLRRIEQLLATGDAEMDRLRAMAADGAVLSLADLEPVLQLTREFHLALNAASNNEVLLRLLRLVDALSMTQRLRKVQGALLRGGGQSYEDLERRYAEHRVVFDAVRAGDGETAERLMLHHASADALGAVH
jgi:DNA-binding GntR family transcriptional regulator